MLISSLFFIPIFFLITFFYLQFNKFIVHDKPNHRSLHLQNTPTSAGILFYIYLVVYHFSLLIFIDNDFEYIFFLLILIPLLIGFLDDLTFVNFISKLFLQFIAITFFIMYFSNFQNEFYLYLFFFIIFFHFINIYNFMDGSDGIALSQSIFFFIYYNIFYHDNFFNNIDLTSIIVFLLIIFYFNFPKAKIFIGNSGSYLLGFLMFIFFLNKFNENFSLFLDWIFIFSFFYIDTSITLIQRIVKRKNIFTAHKEHLYQLICETCRNHNITLYCLNVYNFILILPLIIIINHFFPNIDIVIKIILLVLFIIIYLFIKNYFIKKNRNL